MLPALLRRVAGLVGGLVAATIVVFAFMQVLPADPARVALGVNASEEAVGRLRAEFGLDRPLLTQYLSWVGGLLRGDLGVSYVSRVPIGTQLADRLQVTLWLVVTAMVVALLVAVPLGVFTAVRHRRVSGLVASAVVQVGVAIPAFLAGIALITVFAVRLGWLPANGWTPPSQDLPRFVSQLLLPVASLALVQSAVLTRYVRSAVLDVLAEDYLRTARSKGLRRMQALYRHGLRNAAVPVVTVLGVQLATLLIGAVVVERVFVIPGLGSLLVDAVGSRDLLVVQDTVMLLVVAVLLLAFVTDLLYLLIDPRLRVRRR